MLYQVYYDYKVFTRVKKAFLSRNQIETNHFNDFKAFIKLESFQERLQTSTHFYL